MLTIAILSTSSIAFGATKIEWAGAASGSGDSQISSEFSNGKYDGIEISGIEIFLEGYANLWNKGDTTEGLVISGKNLTVQGNDKNVTIVNVSQNDKIDNNGGMYASNKTPNQFTTPSRVDFIDLKNVYIAAIGGKKREMTVQQSHLKEHMEIKYLFQGIRSD